MTAVFLVIFWRRTSLDVGDGDVYNNVMKKKKKGKIKRILISLFIIAVLVLFAIIYLLPMVTDAFTRTTVVKYGNIQIVDRVTCYFVRDEMVYNASDSGIIQYYFEEGELVRKGSKIIELFPSATSYIAMDNRLVSYYVDGCEEIFTPDAMRTLNKEVIENLQIEVSNIKRDSAISGEPLYKAVDNSLWHVIFWVESDKVLKYTKGDTIYLNLPLGQVKGRTIEIIDNKGSWLIIAEFKCYYQELAKLRKIDAEIITADHEGLLISNKSITTKDGKPGVFVKDISGEFVFTPVSVITSDGEYSLVESSFYYDEDEDKNVRIKTVNAYDEILSNPERE